MKLADVIRSHRLRANLSQDELASRLGVSRQAVQQWEAGKTGPKRKVAATLARVLGIPRSLIDPLAGSVTGADPVDSATLVPLFTLSEAGGVMTGNGMNLIPSEKTEFLAVDPSLSGGFAIRVTDASMAPIYAVHDIVIVDPATQPQENDDIVVRLPNGSAILRRYRPRGLDKAGSPVFDLVTPNADGVTITVNSQNPADILGVAVEVRRTLRR